MEGVLQGFNLERFAPNVIVLENNTGRQEHPVKAYMREHGYSHFTTLGCNEFYSREGHNVSN